MKDDIVAALRVLQPELERRGVARAGLFGSMARGEATENSDIDVLLRFDPSARITLWDYAGLKRYMSVLLRRRFRRPIDVVTLEALHPLARPSAERDVIYAF